MDELIEAIVVERAGSLLPVQRIVERVRGMVPGHLRRDEVLAALSQAGHRLCLVRSRLHLSNAALADR